MASYYVWSGATGSANGTSWANAYTTLTLAFSGHAAGDTYYVAHDHAETTASAITLSSLGTIGVPTKVICVNRAGSVPPVSADRRATATVTSTGSTVTLNGYTHFDGIIFKSASHMFVAQTINHYVRFDNCSLQATGSSGILQMGDTSGGNYVELNNTTFSFANVSNTISVYSMMKWRNTPSAVLGTIPTVLFNPGASGRGTNIECIGVDLGAVSTTLIGIVAGMGGHSYRFVDCKLHASVAKSGTPTAVGGQEIDFVRSGATGVNYTVYRNRYPGVLTEETTIVRTGGATG